MRTTKTKLLALLAALLMIAAACGSDDSSGPGDGVEVTMARADWSTGYFQAYVYEALLEELGYVVSDPADLELGPSLAYLSMAQGDFDFWVNSWYPGHLSWHEAEMPDGSLVGDSVTIVGEEMIAGGLQGFLVTKSFADEYGITTLDQLNSDPEILAAFDASDPVPGNGVADIYGCQESWTCDNIILAQIEFSGWENIAQTIAGYDAMMAEAVAKADAGEPMVIYTWTPSAYITNLIPGENVVWLAMDDVLDDSNPTGEEGGEGWDQRPGTASIGPDECPAAADAGTCQLGWVAADIQVTANSDWLAENPAAEALFAEVKLPVIDVSLANVEQDGGADTNEAIQGLAADWIAENRELVDGWLETARAAS
ncbi:MAG: glycine betaine/L-proline ABC transporter substrate-binding protein ProX [Actinomycetota bacterium]